MARVSNLMALLPLLLLASPVASQDADPSSEGLTSLADDQEGTVTVYGIGPAAETSTGALLARTADPAFFTLLRPTACQEPVPVESRNPFLLLEEQAAGLTRAQILEASALAATQQQALEAERARESIIQAASTVLSDSERERSTRLTQLRAQVEELRINALLIGASGSAALLNGSVIRPGDSILDGSVRIAAITIDGVRVALGEESVLVALAPLSAARTSDSPSASDSMARETTPSEPPTNEGDENP